jgi:ferritin
MQKSLNEQINKELYSAYLYLSMSAWFDNNNLPGFAKWMHMQAEEEYEHAMKFFGHIADRGGKVELKAIAGPQVDWKSNLEVVEEVLKHEEFVTASINALYDQALLEKDYPAQVMLQWFIDEQVEEEKNASELVHLVSALGKNETGLVMLDQRLAQRESD